MNKIQAIVIDGFHEGHSIFMEYSPTLKLLRPKSITVDYCCDADEYSKFDLGDDEYKECFRSLDRKIVLYSTNGNSEDFMKNFIRQFTDKPWTKNTVLYYGYHNEPVMREDDEGKRITN